jgi:hypothetical protein
MFCAVSPRSEVFHQEKLSTRVDRRVKIRPEIGRQRWRKRSAIIGRMTDVTQILSQIEDGDPSAAEQLLPLVYDELRKLAEARLAHPLLISGGRFTARIRHMAIKTMGIRHLQGHRHLAGN